MHLYSIYTHIYFNINYSSTQRILIKLNRKYCICCYRRKKMDLIFQEIVLSNSLLTFFATSMKTTTMVILDCEWSSYKSIPMFEILPTVHTYIMIYLQNGRCVCYMFQSTCTYVPVNVFSVIPAYPRASACVSVITLRHYNNKMKINLPGFRHNLKLL